MVKRLAELTKIRDRKSWKKGDTTLERTERVAANPGRVRGHGRDVTADIKQIEAAVRVACL